MKKTVLIFSGLILALILLFQISTYSVVMGYSKIEFVIGIIAVIFFFVGLYINKKSLKRRQTTSHKIDCDKIAQLEITSREYEVLQGIAEGLSNKEIGDKLFLSESTIKTHVSNVLLKLGAKRRTQAVQIAKDLQIIS